jgi:type 1 glutamine amidotransferase
MTSPTSTTTSDPGNRMAANVTALATSLLPPESPKRETVAWSIERADSGRGFGIVMPHFYKNWRDEDLRRFILNGIAWTAKLEVPPRRCEDHVARPRHLPARLRGLHPTTTETEEHARETEVM